MANSVITLDEALSIVLSTTKPLATETLPLNKLLHRVLSNNILSRCDMPPFDKSAMDGFACKKEDIGSALNVIGEVQAGDVFEGMLNSGEAIRIMTGAPVPLGADMVVMKEIARETDGLVSFEGSPKNSNICYKGEDVRTGDIVLQKGVLLTSRHIAVLTSAGYASAEVFKPPKVAVFATGNELVEPGGNLGTGQIFNSNAHQLVAECASIGLYANYLGVLPDALQEVTEALRIATQEYDAIILSGGVSVGDYDFIPLALKALSFDVKFHTLNTKPGKHTVFATNGSCYVLGLPGNPVSTLVQFELVGKVLLGALQGIATLENKYFKAQLSANYKRKSADRLEFLPAIINQFGEVELLTYNGSAHISALTQANFLVQIPVGVSSLNKGELVDVRPL